MGSIAFQQPVEAPFQESEYNEPKSNHLKAELPLQESSYNVPPAAYPKASKAPIPSSAVEIKKIVERSVDGLNYILEKQNYEGLSDLMALTYWRDHLGLLNTGMTTLYGPAEVISFIQQNGGKCNIKRFALEAGKEATIANLDPKGTVKCLQAYITFETEDGNGRGVMRLVQDVEIGDEWRIYTVFTTLNELKAHPWMTGYTRPYHAMSPEIFPEGMNWKEAREEQRDFKHDEPTVLIVGKCLTRLAGRIELIGAQVLDTVV
jgi:hypothetical protein